MRPPSAAPAPDRTAAAGGRLAAVRPAARRVLALARAQALLLLRNRTTLVYAVGLPVAPLALLAAGPSTAVSQAGAIELGVLVAMLFPVFYALLSSVVARRDESVLQRLRTGELADREIVLGLALPGAVLGLVACAAVVAVALLAGVSAPRDPLLLVLAVLGLVVVFSALALATAAFSRDVESVQLSSAPVLLLGMAGSFLPLLDGPARALVESTPGGALVTVVRASWFGISATDASATLPGAAATSAALGGLAVIAVWTVLAVWTARRRMTWSPRA
ncbi:ABC transporter permease [Nocardioides sp. TRM66260-LWL]|uniref:ABC transporter permease n=1 Tax=Nocardioides sp. TRM66260-LWL TaxID=2874478 RepID=UPI001CC3C897|nr:ABC transporter permease [Nocardioides sp. TRM66260-LWL]MBZ5733084.1 ABC transporter permease [Nocardioides sp. TRM66260-LWL]